MLLGGSGRAFAARDSSGFTRDVQVRSFPKVRLQASFLTVRACLGSVLRPRLPRDKAANLTAQIRKILEDFQVRKCADSNLARFVRIFGSKSGEIWGSYGSNLTEMLGILGQRTGLVAFQSLGKDAIAILRTPVLEGFGVGQVRITHPKLLFGKKFRPFVFGFPEVFWEPKKTKIQFWQAGKKWPNVMSSAFGGKR